MKEPNKLVCSIPQPESLASDKNSNLLAQFLSYEGNEVFWIRTLEPYFIILYFIPVS